MFFFSSASDRTSADSAVTNVADAASPIATTEASAATVMIDLYGFENGKIKIYKYSSHGLGHLEGVDHEQWWKDILEVHYHPERKEKIKSKYKNRPAVSTLRVSTHQIYKRFEKLNKGSDKV